MAGGPDCTPCRHPCGATGVPRGAPPAIAHFTLGRASGPGPAGNEIVISIHRDDINVGMAGARKRCFSLNLAARIGARGPPLSPRRPTFLSLDRERRTRPPARSGAALRAAGTASPLQPDVHCCIWVRMDLQLRGKRAVVTGSTAGIGLAIAIDLAREGASVVVNGRTQRRVDAALAQIRDEVREARVEAVAVDLGTASGAQALIAQASDTDILVNNVGIFEAVPFERIDDASWLRLFETNVMSGVRLSRHYFPRMLQRGWGRVLFISSESALQIPAEMIHYGVTKTAQLALARGLAELTTGTQVTVNSVLPGPTRSEGVGAFVEGLARQQRKDAAQVERDFLQQMRPSSLLQRFAEPAEVAHLVAFLASPLAAATNGAALRVDGGVVRAIV